LKREMTKIVMGEKWNEENSYIIVFIFIA
jgi:hypothetical protein